MKALADPPSPLSEALRTTPPLRQKRDRAAKLAKDVAKAAGTAWSIALHIALFPVRGPIHFIKQRRAKRKAMETSSKIKIWLSGGQILPRPPPPAHLAETAPDPYTSEVNECLGPALRHGYSYDWARLPGELPALAEMEGAWSGAELAVTERLLRTEVGRGEVSIF